MPHWWEEPFAMVQTNIREIDSAMDLDHVISDIKDYFGANVWLLNVGGIVSHYPSKLPYQHPSPWLKDVPGGDMTKLAIEKAHANGISVIGRLDMSKAHADVLAAHPHWFFVDKNGKTPEYNETYPTCPNGWYQSEGTMHVLEEVLTNYKLDGIFFNMFGFQTGDYSGNYLGLCQCQGCKRRFRQMFGRELPVDENWNDPNYIDYLTKFRPTIMAELAKEVHRTIKSLRSDVARVGGNFFTPAVDNRGGVSAPVLNPHCDVILHEVNLSVDRPRPIWPYWAGEQPKMSRTMAYGRPLMNLNVYFVDIPYRFSAEQPGLVGLHVAQSIANGGNPTVYMCAPTMQWDKKSFPVVKDLFALFNANKDYYRKQQSVAKIALLFSQKVSDHYGKAETLEKSFSHYRGWYRALVEKHLPFDVVHEMSLAEFEESGKLAQYEVIIAPNVAVMSDEDAALLDRFVEKGGGLVATFETSHFGDLGKPRAGFALKSLGVESVERRQDNMRSAYFRVKPEEGFQGFDDNVLAVLDKAYLYTKQKEGSSKSLSLIPPSWFGPPEKNYWTIETEHPGIVWNSYGKGKTAYFPWQPDRLYFFLSEPEHSTLMAQAVDRVAPSPRQVVTDAPEQIEVTLMRQEGTGKLSAHFVNFSGHSDRSFRMPLPIHDLKVSVATDAAPSHARAAKSQSSLPVTYENGYATFTLPRLDLYEMVTLE